MIRFTKFIETLFIPALALIGLLVSLADSFGLFNLIPSNRIPVLTLFLVSLALSSLSFVHRKSTEAHQDVQRLLLRIGPEHISKVLQQIDPHLRKVLKDDYFMDVLEFFQAAVEERKVRLNDGARFRFYFIRTLLSYPKATFLSTEPSLWRDPSIQSITARFIQNGGRIEQIIFIKNPEELTSTEMLAALDRLHNIGILVHIVYSTSTPGDLKKNFIVGAKRRIAWETEVDNEGQVGASTVTTNARIIAHYRIIFEKLRESAIRSGTT